MLTLETLGAGMLLAFSIGYVLGHRAGFRRRWR